ncbi:hypothetical protein PR048_000915 [Dryococelus australis]|uniref:Uncharacterized protein n=1 Tax=Dryococelus australis TaxID=614101 RepID=A0ABQ9IFW7_9NEOP|nr:hypothetical protein PR048_000915 [Dryococelus australis]
MEKRRNARARETGYLRENPPTSSIVRHDTLVHFVLGLGGVVVRLLASHLGKPGSIPGEVTTGFSHVGIVANDAAVMWVFSGISRFPCLFIPAKLHARLTSPTSTLKTSVLKACRRPPVAQAIAGSSPSERQLLQTTSDLATGVSVADIEFISSSVAVKVSLSNKWHKRRQDLNTSLTKHVFSCNVGVAVAERFDCSPPNNPDQVTPRFSKLGIVPDDAAGRRVFLGISRFPHPFTPALLHTHFIAPSSALRTLLLRAGQIFLLNSTQL